MLAKMIQHRTALYDQPGFYATSVNLPMLLQTLCHLPQHYLFYLMKQYCNIPESFFMSLLGVNSRLFPKLTFHKGRVLYNYQ